MKWRGNISPFTIERAAMLFAAAAAASISAPSGSILEQKFAAGGYKRRAPRNRRPIHKRRKLGRAW